MSDTVKIGVDDGCLGLDSPSGRTYHFNDHVAEVPAAEARRFLGASGADHLHKHSKPIIGWSRRSERALERVFGKETHVSAD